MDPKKHALFEQAASVELTAFNPSASMVGYEIRFKPCVSLLLLPVLQVIFTERSRRRRGLQPDQAVVDKEIAAIDKKLEAYDVILAKQRYLAGDVRTPTSTLTGLISAIIEGIDPGGPLPPPVRPAARDRGERRHDAEAQRCAVRSSAHLQIAAETPKVVQRADIETVVAGVSGWGEDHARVSQLTNDSCGHMINLNLVTQIDTWNALLELCSCK
jgi:hypothetical protein